jgi:hypothetical protein
MRVAAEGLDTALDQYPAQLTCRGLSLISTNSHCCNCLSLQGESSPNIRGIAPTRQFHSVYQDKEGNHGEGRRRRDSSDREGERKGSEDDDDEEQSHASFDSTDGKTHHLCVFIGG